MRRRFSYANVAATLALVFSMSSGALAAKHYLITSTKQIKPNVLKELRGKTGAIGPRGSQGAVGQEGKPGPEGKAGLTSSELETLKNILPHITYVASGVGGKPTVQFSGVDVQLVNGEGKTETANGEGNLVIGYDENPGKREQTGSHDLVLGESQTFTSYGGIVAGLGDTISAPFASVTGGEENTASSRYASVTGGQQNTASRAYTTVSGGYGNKASGEHGSVSGGILNAASGPYTSVSGGEFDAASSYDGSVSGGYNNTASGQNASVSGGYKNTAAGLRSSIFGGKELTANNEYEAIP
jgi:hypothetical protein